MKSDAILRTQAINAIQQCCQVGCGTKQPIVDYIVHLERQIEEGNTVNRDKWVQDEGIQESDAAFFLAKLAVIIILIGCCLVFGLTACKTTPEQISARADAINEKIDEEQARANQDIDEAQAVGEAAKEAIETIVENLEESVEDVVDNAKESAEAVKEQ